MVHLFSRHVGSLDKSEVKLAYNIPVPWNVEYEAM